MTDTTNLRDQIAESLLKILRDGEPVIGRDDDGKPIVIATKPAAASYFAVAREFVKDHPPATLPMVGGAVGTLAKFQKKLASVPSAPHAAADAVQ